MNKQKVSFDDSSGISICDRPVEKKEPCLNNVSMKEAKVVCNGVDNSESVGKGWVRSSSVVQMKFVL